MSIEGTGSLIDRNNEEVMTKNKSRLDQALDNLGKEVSLLHQTMDTLGQKLQPVILQVPEADSKDATGGFALQHSSEAVSRIDQSAIQIRIATDAAKRLLETIEV